MLGEKSNVDMDMEDEMLGMYTDNDIQRSTRKCSCKCKYEYTYISTVTDIQQGLPHTQ